MYDPMTKRGVLSDFDLAREGGQNRRPSAKDNTGTLPFLALDLLNKRASEGLVPRRYRQDAESFAWCLIYICICVGKDERSNRHHQPPSLIIVVQDHSHFLCLQGHAQEGAAS